jgi:hypothetical protein
MASCSAWTRCSARPAVVDPGKYLDAVEYVLDPTDLESIKITVGAKEIECNLNNNEVVLQGPFCQ